MNFTESRMKPGFQLRHRYMWREFVVEDGEWEAKLGAELTQGKFGAVCLCENVIRGFPDSRKVIHQSAGPIKDNVANHETMLAEANEGATESNGYLGAPMDDAVKTIVGE